MGLYDKLKWILGIIMIFVLIITTNLIDKDNFVRVRDSVITIYEDRLKANDIIFDMLLLIQDKELALVRSEENTSHLKKLQTLIKKFEQTKLTKEEAQIFNDLKDNISLLETFETDKSSTSTTDKKVNYTLLEIKENLKDLSDIQLNEGSRQMSIINRAVDTVELFTQIEIYILVFLAILIQIVVMYNPKK